MAILWAALGLSGRVLWSRVGRFWLAATALVAITLALLPQLGTLNYYFSFVVAFVVGPGAFHLGLAAGRRLLSRRGLVGPGEESAAILAALFSAALLAVVPLVIVTLNALRVQPCDYWGGLLFFALGPLAGALYSSLPGFAVGALVRRRHLARAMVAVLVSATIAFPLARLYFGPAIHLYHPVVGYFSGAIYDEVIEVRLPFVAFRLVNLLEALLVVVAVRLSRTSRAMPSAASARAPMRLRGWFILLLSVTALCWWSPRHLGYRFDRAAIRAELGGLIETPNFELIYPGDTSYEQVAPRVAVELERIHEELTTLMGRAPVRRTRVFVYADAAQKRRLMGADQVSVVKPWLAEVHLNRVDVGASVIAHELVHALFAACARGPLKMPARLAVLPQMGIVEGLAVALDGRGGRLTLHEAAAAMRQLDLAPDMQRIMSSDGFWSAPAGRAYVTAGSFVRHLIDQYGPGPLCPLYRHGDFKAAFGLSLTELVEDWLALLDDPQRVPLGEEELQLAADAFARRSVFQRTCALEVARMRRAAAERTRARDFQGAVVLLDAVVAVEPEAPAKRYDLARALLRAEEYDRARATFAALAEDESVRRMLRLRARVGQADLAWLTGDRQTAARAYRGLLSEPMGRALRRRLLIAERGAGGSEARADVMRDFLLRPLLPGVRESLLEDYLALSPGDVIARYLLGRKRFVDGREMSAVRELETALAGARLPPVIAQEARMTLGIARFRCEDYPGARAALLAAMEFADLEGERQVIAQWLARIEWFKSSGDVSRRRLPANRETAAASRANASSNGDPGDPPPPAAQPPLGDGLGVDSGGPPARSPGASRAAEPDSTRSVLGLMGN